MDVLHVSHLCHLAAAFGTERYQYDLIAESRAHGVRGTLLWLSPRAVASASGDAVPVVPVTAASLDALRAVVARRLDAQPPQLLHFHSMGRAESVVADLAHARGIPYVFTYHAPFSLCATGGLLRWGSRVCDGEVRAWRCGACRGAALLHALPRGLRWQRLRQWAADSAPAPGADERPIPRRASAVRAFLAPCARILVHAEPARGVLLANGAAPEAVAVCAPGVSAAFAAARAGADRPMSVRAAPGSPFVVGYVGRLDRLKGFGILVEAFLRTTWPQTRLRLVGATPEQRRVAGYAGRMIERARADARIEFAAMHPLTSGAALYDGMSLVAIPSLGVETGPLVLREAVQLGLPVLATDRLGEPHLARAHARLVAPNTVAAWTDALETVFAAARRGGLAPRPPLAPGDPARRTMREVARDVVDEYRTVLGGCAAAAAR